jgi:hypothetical protein
MHRASGPSGRRTWNGTLEGIEWWRQIHERADEENE